MTGVDLERTLRGIADELARDAERHTAENHVAEWWVTVAYSDIVAHAAASIRKISRRALRVYKNHPRVQAVVGNGEDLSHPAPQSGNPEARDAE